MTTKQATKDIVISKTESLVLLKNMMRISISSICFVRDLFPRGCFKNKPYGNVDIHQLQGARKEENGDIIVTHPDAFLLTQWLEQGVFHALEHEYLSSMTFAIYSKHPITKDDILLESYEFKTTYQGEGTAKINDVSLVSKESVKGQAAKFIRSLTEFSGTLDILPDNCWITLQLKYFDHTPAEYEPDYFRASDGSLATVAERLPLVINIGTMHTPSMDMKLKYAGLDSLLFEDLCKASPHGDMSLCTPPFREPSILLAKGGSITNELQRMEVDSPHTTQNTQVISHRSPVEPVQDTSKLADFNRIKDYITSGGSMTRLTCARALTLTEKDVQTAFNTLLKSGTIEQKGKNKQKKLLYQLCTNSVIPVEAESGSAAVLDSTASTSISIAQQMQMRTPQDSPGHSCAETSVSTVARCSHAPAAPRKAPVKPPYLHESQMTDDIEETCPVTTSRISVTGQKHIQTQLRLKSGANTDIVQAPMGHGKRRAIQEAQVAISLSQESVLSDGCSRKKNRRCSVVRDPIQLAGLHAVAQENRQPTPSE